MLGYLRPWDGLSLLHSASPRDAVMPYYRIRYASRFRHCEKREGDPKTSIAVRRESGAFAKICFVESIWLDVCGCFQCQMVAANQTARTSASVRVPGSETQMAAPGRWGG